MIAPPTHHLHKGYPAGFYTAASAVAVDEGIQWWILTRNAPGSVEGYKDQFPGRARGWQSYAFYAEFGIKGIMPTPGLCRLLLVVFPI